MIELQEYDNTDENSMFVFFFNVQPTMVPP